MAEATTFDADLLSRIEDASLNASAPPQQLWMDGWLLRFNPGKAKRARCINAVAAGRMPLNEKLQRARQAYDEAGLPMVVRITRFTHPHDLDGQLEALGYTTQDDTRVMVRRAETEADDAALQAEVPEGLTWVPLPAPAYAQAVAMLRGSSPEQCAAHAQRLSVAPVPCRGYGLQSSTDGAVLACGQFAREGDLVGLYDVFTRPNLRQKGLATLICKRLLSISVSEGAQFSYLQVDSENTAARTIYARMGFTEGYAYHYRVPPVV